MAQTATISRPPLVLLVYPDEWLSRSIESILRPHGYEVWRATRAAEAVERAREGKPDAILLELQLPGADGIELCRRLRREPDVGATTPILVTTAGPVPRTARLHALRAGAWDCLSGPVDALELVERLAVYVTAKLEADRLREQSLLDHVTGLYSARGLLHRARELAAGAFRHRRAIACVALGPAFDGVPYDPAAFRRLLETLAGVLGTRVRRADAAGRWGPVEFAVLAPETDLDAARGLAWRIIAAIDVALERTPEVAGLEFRAGCYGVRDFRAVAGSAAEGVEMLARATRALRRVQADPRGARVLASEEA